MISVTGDSTSKLEQSFNKFANYMLYGENSSTGFTGSYQYGNQYYFNNLSSNAERKDFLAVAREKFQQFYDLYNGSLGTDGQNDSDKAESTNGLLQILDTYKSDLDMSIYIQSSPLLSANEIMSYYIADPETVESEINTYYSASNDMSNDVLIYAGQNIQNADSLLSAYKVFDQKDCIAESGRINDICFISSDAALVNASQVVQEYNKIFAATSAEDHNRSIRLYQNIWVMQEKLNEKN